MMDVSKEEMGKGLTVETGSVQFVSPKKNKITLLDTPGHLGFLE